MDRGFTVTAIEKDRELAALVAERLPSVRVIAGDALKLDWHTLMASAERYVIGNIPYNITSPLLARAMIPPLPVRGRCFSCRKKWPIASPPAPARAPMAH